MDNTISLTPNTLREKLQKVCLRYLSAKDSRIIAQMIVSAEQMGVYSHGIHYFLFSILPLVKKNKTGQVCFQNTGNTLCAEGSGGIGFMNMGECLQKASRIARKAGSCLILYKNPGKIGALRLYCQELMDRGQFILMCKNTAATVGLPETGEPVIGTNPLCMGFPDSKFIYDASTSTVATNKVRYFKKSGQTFDHPIGCDRLLKETRKPGPILKKEGFLLPHGYQGYWFKSFFVGVAIECLSALAGGKTGIRVGKRKGRRLYSDEGLFALIIDKKSFVHYDNYLREQRALFKDLRKYAIRIPGQKRQNQKLKILKTDWLELDHS